MSLTKKITNKYSAYVPDGSKLTSPHVRQIDRAFNKANARGICVNPETLVELTGSWRAQSAREQAQSCWDERCAKNRYKFAWRIATNLLPSHLVDEMTEPGEKGIRAAMLRRLDIRAELMNFVISDTNTLITAEYLAGQVRRALERGWHGTFWQNETPDRIYYVLAASLIAKEIAIDVQHEVDYQSLQSSTAVVQVKKSAVRL